MGYDGVTNTSTDSQGSPSKADAVSNDGGGGGLMDIWSDSIDNLIDQTFGLLGGTGETLSNGSSQPVPNGYVGVGNTSTESQGEPGYAATANIRDKDGRALDASGNLLEDGSIISASSGKGPIRVSSSIDQGAIQSGNDSTLPLGSYTVEFKPISGGIIATRTVSLATDSFGQISYSEVNGSVTDAIGNPVGDVGISGNGGGAVSDPDGTYTLLAPSGSIDLESGDIGSSKSVTVPQGGSTTLDWSFSGIRVRVTLPGGSPAIGVPVACSYLSGVERTDSNGEALFPEIEVNQSGGSISILTEITRDADTFSEGGITNISVELDASITGNVEDSQSNESSSDVDVRANLGDTSFITLSGGGGDYITGVITQDLPIEVEVLAADDDKRYGSRSRTVTIGQGDIVSVDFDLPVLRVPTEAL